MLFIIFCNYAPFCLEFSAVHNNSTITLFAFVFDWDEMCDVRIPIPAIEIQQDIVNIYEAYLTRKEINEKLKTQIKNLCPILIKGSIEEAQG